MLHAYASRSFEARRNQQCDIFAHMKETKNSHFPIVPPSLLFVFLVVMHADKIHESQRPAVNVRYAQFQIPPLY